jgi:hypothetical protein
MLLEQMLDLCESVWRLSLRVDPQDYQASRLPFVVHQIGRVLEVERPGRLGQIADELAYEETL